MIKTEITHLYFLRDVLVAVASLNLKVPISFVAHFRDLVGSFSNDDADGNENSKTATGLLSKTTSLHVHHAFFVHFFAVTARLRRENA